MTLRDIYLSDLSHLLDAIRQKLLEWPVLSARAESPALRNAFDDHYAQSRIHEAQIEGVFMQLDERPRNGPFDGLPALVRLWRTRYLDADLGRFRELSLVTAAMVMDHYTLPLFAEAITVAKAIGDQEGARVLEAARGEEQTWNGRLAMLHDWLAVQLSAPEGEHWSLPASARSWEAERSDLATLAPAPSRPPANQSLAGALPPHE